MLYESTTPLPLSTGTSLDNRRRKLNRLGPLPLRLQKHLGRVGICHVGLPRVKRRHLGTDGRFHLYQHNQQLNNMDEGLNAWN